MIHHPSALGNLCTVMFFKAMLVMATLGPAFAVQDSANGPNRPNVLLIIVDDLNDWVGCLDGHPNAITPNIDRLAARGVLFTRAYCAAPVCSPSRVAMLTGIRPSTSGIYHNGQPWRPALRDVVTLTQHLMAHGYHVVVNGKVYPRRHPVPGLWHEHFRGGSDPEAVKSSASDPENVAASIVWGSLDVDDSQMADYTIVDRCITFLQRADTPPFFLACGIVRPHLPWFVPRGYYDLHPVDQISLPEVRDTDLDDVPPAGRRMARQQVDHLHMLQANNWQKAVQAYLASVTFADAQVGRLLDALDASPHADNTIIVLWSDHGWHLGEKQHWRKFALWEEATRVPLIFVAPNVTEPTGICQRTVDSQHIYPTIAELCGLPVPEHVDGKSLVSLLKEPSASWPLPALTTYGQGNHAVRTERWRYIRYADGSEELYDHKSDPMEWTNLASKPEHATLKTELAQWMPTHDNGTERRSVAWYVTAGTAGVVLVIVVGMLWRRRCCTADA